MAASEEKDAGRVLSKQQVLSLYLPALLMSLGAGLVAPVLPVFAKSFGISFEIAALVIIIQQVGALAAALPAGYLMDKIGRRPVLLAGPIILALSALLMATAQSFPQLVIYRFFGGAGNQFWMQARLGVIADTTAQSRRARQITWMIGLQRCGMLLGPAVGGLIATAWSIRLPFVIHGIMTLLAIIPSFKLIRETAPTAGAAGTKMGGPRNNEWRQLMVILFGFQMLAFLLIQFLATLCRGGESGIINLYAAFVYNLRPDTIGYLTAASATVALPIPFITGYLMDRYRRKIVIVPSFCLYAGALVAMAVTAYGAMPLLAFVAAFFLVQSTVSTTNGTMQVLGSDLSPDFARGRFFGIWRFIAQIGALTGPVIFAVIKRYVDYGTAFMALGLASLGVAFVVGVFLKETLRREPAQVTGS